MIRQILGYKSLMLLALVVALLLSQIPGPVLADSGLSVSEAGILVDVNPGQTLTHTMAVAIDSGDPATDISVGVFGVQQFPDGGYELLDSSRDTNQYSARRFVTVDKDAFHLEPGSSENITATVIVPQDLGAGGRYAMIHIASKPMGMGGVGIATAVDVPVYLTVKNSQLIHTGKISGVATSEITTGQPIHILTDFQSTGNHHFKVKGEITVTNDQGQNLDTITTPVTSSSILPGMARRLETSFIPSGDLAAGTYVVSSKVMLEDGTYLDQSSTTFQVTAPYTPPPALGTLMLSPASASTLQSQNGCISIYFPQGAAVVPVEVSLREYPAAQLPSPSPGITLTSNCFRLDGITGLLAKEMTVTVCYSADDLKMNQYGSITGVDASRLRLAYWDEAYGQWTVLKTKVDKEVMKVTASSNQGRIWAVVVGSTAGAGSGWTMPIWAKVVLIVVGVVVLLLAFFFVVGVMVERSEKKGGKRPSARKAVRRR